MEEKPNAIVVPIVRSDLGLIKSVLQYWMAENPPFEKEIDGLSTDLIYVVSSGESANFRAALEAICDESGIRRQFRSVRVHFACIPPELDYYMRKTQGMPPTSNGFPSGPNEVFFHIAETFGDEYECCFLMELDCLPIRENWGVQLHLEMSRFPNAWVVGSRYHGWSWLSPRIHDHLNGNAIYRFSDPAFQSFLKEIWKPGIKELHQWGYPYLAYDCFPSLLDSLCRGPLVPAEFRAKNSNGFGRFCESYFVLNLSGEEDKRSDYETVERISQLNPQTIMLHASWLLPELLKPEEVEVPLEDNDAVNSALIHEELSYSIKHLYASDGVWVFGDQFAFRREDSLITLHILVDKEKLQSITVSAESEDVVPMIVRGWNEEMSIGFNLTSLIGAVIKIFGLSKLVSIDYIRSKTRGILNSIEYFSRTKALDLLRIWLGQLRGRKICKGENSVTVSTALLKKANGMTVTLCGMDQLVEGTIKINAEYR